MVARRRPDPSSPEWGGGDVAGVSLTCGSYGDVFLEIHFGDKRGSDRRADDRRHDVYAAWTRSSSVSKSPQSGDTGVDGVNGGRVQFLMG